MSYRYEITKTFIGGLLKSITIVEETSILWTAGTIVKRPYGRTSTYRIDSVRVIG